MSSSSLNEAAVEEEELYSSWALLIQIVLLILALWTSYYLQIKQIRSIHETVISIFAAILAWTGIDSLSLTLLDSMIFGSVLSATDPVTVLTIFQTLKVDPQLYAVIFGESILNDATAIVLYETLRQYRGQDFHLTNISHGILSFFVNFGASLFFGFMLLHNVELPKTDMHGGQMLYQYLEVIRFENIKLLDLYSREGLGSLILSDLAGHQFVRIGFGSSAVLLYILQFLNWHVYMLKYSKLYKFPAIESCIIALMAYASYLFSNGCHLSGIVSLLFCGITLKHYAYDNMSLTTKRTTKYMFRVLAQLSENFIFIYLGLTLFTEKDLEYKPFFIFFTAIFICVSRYCAVFPISNMLNAIARYRKRSEMLPNKHSIMIFWCGLRGAVAFALAAGLKGDNANAMKATILVVVVLSVIVFGGTTSRMLEVLKIETGVDEGEIDSDDEGYSEYNNYNHVLTNSQGSVVSSGTGGSTEHNIPSRIMPTINNINNVSTHAHWFISFDDKYLKPLFTRQHDIKPEDRWQKENSNNDEIVGLSLDHTITRV
ncbi:7828_t:CDS:2 [Cetraspora pellucida]|uniref:7828_t:CDS:1 n=1 Tax=Cetraspora pellucida TaxID=1433469 RepID=A0ACA9KFS6_9GLOM|nr:7828_t:CDS:2 [Cetraspora pellucida]